MAIPLVGLLCFAFALVSPLLLISVYCYRRHRRPHHHDIDIDIECGTGTGTVTGSRSSRSKVADAAPTSIRQLSWTEIESLTDNFSSKSIIGEGGFSTVYLSTTTLNPPTAIKVHTSSQRLHHAFLREIHALLRLQHPNIVTLLAYSNHDGHDEGALLFDFAPNGTLHDLLHNNKNNNENEEEEEGTSLHLPWSGRMSIAYRLALAIEYLHHGCDPQIVHGDIKAANVLLDARTEPKLCDFGSVAVGFSAAVQSQSQSATGKVGSMTGSPGYVDPHYLHTGLMSKKSDVYSFGVLLLELVTGQEAVCSETDRPLMATVGPLLKEAEGRAAEVDIDRRLGGDYDAAEAAAVLELAGRCVRDQPSLRPSMAEVVRVTRDILRVPVGDDERSDSDGKPTD